MIISNGQNTGMNTARENNNFPKKVVVMSNTVSPEKKTTLNKKDDL